MLRVDSGFLVGQDREFLKCGVQIPFSADEDISALLVSTVCFG